MSLSVHIATPVCVYRLNHVSCLKKKSCFFFLKLAHCFFTNIKYTWLKEKTGEEDEGHQQPQGECISSWPTCSSEAFSHLHPKGWRWQTWSDTMDVLRNCLFPEIPSTYTLSWTAVVHKDKSVVGLLALLSPSWNELCSLCQQDAHHGAADG